MKNLIKREQSQTSLHFAERENFGPEVKRVCLLIIAAILVCGLAVTASISLVSQ